MHGELYYINFIKCKSEKINNAVLYFSILHGDTLRNKGHYLVYLTNHVVLKREGVRLSLNGRLQMTSKPLKVLLTHQLIYEDQKVGEENR